MKELFCDAAAVACIRGGGGIHGKVSFLPRGRGTLVVADISGLPETETNFFALHIHTDGDCPGSSGHFDPRNVPHPRHAGDLPPLLSCGGKAWLAVMTQRFSVEDVVGRSVVIHCGPDDFKTQPSGDPGERIACGRISRI